MMRIGANLKNLPKFRLFSAIREHQAGITSNRGSARRGEFVPEPCTPRPSLGESRVQWKSLEVSFLFYTLKKCRVLTSELS